MRSRLAKRSNRLHCDFVILLFLFDQKKKRKTNLAIEGKFKHCLNLNERRLVRLFFFILNVVFFSLWQLKKNLVSSRLGKHIVSRATVSRCLVKMGSQIHGETWLS